MQPGWCCVAVQQTTGRGRLGRSWSDPSAGCATFTISQSFDRKHPERLSLQIGVAIANAVDATLRSVTTHSDSSESQPAVQIRWPNDVMVGNRKLAGVLIEVHHDIAWIGIGINVLHQKWPVELENIAISLAELPAVGSTHSLEQPDIIIAILESLEAVQSYNDEQLIAAFGRRNYLQDRICTFEHAGVRHTGRIHSFNPLVGLELDVSKGGINRNVNAETSPAPQIVHLPAQTTSLVHDK